jgi:membrane protein
MIATAKILAARLRRYVWSTDLATLTRWHARGLWALRFTYVLARDVARDRLSLRATSLVYTTLLSLVPLLAVSVSILKSIGIQRQLEPVLMDFFDPLGDKGHALAVQIMTFVNDLHVGVLGAVGLALVVYTGITLLHQTEQAFNEIWHVDRARALWRRFSGYVSVLLVGPILVVAAVSITASVMSTSVVLKLMEMGTIGTAVALGGKLLSSALVVIAFTVAFGFVPNTRVRLSAALTGGVVAGVLWELAGWAFAALMVGSTTYTALYSSFAIVILFFVWLYVSWTIVLVGASIAYYTQNLDEVARRETDAMESYGVGERLLLTVMLHIARALLAGERDFSRAELACKCRVSGETLEPVLAALVSGEWVKLTADDPPRYSPVTALDQIEIAQLWRTAHSSSAGDVPEVVTLLQEIDAAITLGLHGTTLHDWVTRSTANPT